MTDLDDLPLFTPTPANPGTPPPRKPRKCRRHSWQPYHIVNEQGITEWCGRCHRWRDDTLTHRARSSVRLGKDQERRIERVYGPRKVGEYGDPVDHLGRDFKWQAKSTRSLPPKWLAAITEATWKAILPTSILNPMARMAGIGGDRAPLVIRSYVRQGVPTRDWLFVPEVYWFRLHNRHPFPGRIGDYGYIVFPGASFLDIHGRDEETP